LVGQILHDTLIANGAYRPKQTDTVSHLGSFTSTATDTMETVTMATKSLCGQKIVKNILKM